MSVWETILIPTVCQFYRHVLKSELFQSAHLGSIIPDLALRGTNSLDISELCSGLLGPRINAAAAHFISANLNDVTRYSMIVLGHGTGIHPILFTLFFNGVSNPLPHDVVGWEIDPHRYIHSQVVLHLCLSLRHISSAIDQDCTPTLYRGSLTCDRFFEEDLIGDVLIFMNNGDCSRGNFY